MKNNCIDIPSKVVSLFTRVTLLILVSASTLYSQEFEWQNTIGGSLYDNLTSISQTVEGGYIFGGASNSPVSGDKNETCRGDYDYWIVKTGSQGNYQWQNTLGGSSYDLMYSLHQTIDGGFILGGFSDSDISWEKWEDCLGSGDYWIVKTDGSGNIQWQNTISGGSQDVLQSIQQTSDGSYILGGYSDSNISGDKTENRIGGFDYWVVKTDTTGNIQWQNTIGGSGYDMLNSIQQTQDGGFILGGYSSSNISGDKTENNIGGSRDYWIVKTDTMGNIQWQNTIGGNGQDDLFSVEQTTDGGFILGGYSNSGISGDKTENSFGGDDYWIVKTDSLGIIEWQKTIGGSGQDLLTSIKQTTEGGYVLCGYSNSGISGVKTENCLGDFDYWVIKIDSVGVIQWQNTIGGNMQDLLYSIEQTSDGGYLLGGSSNSNISEDKTENGLGNEDFWVVKLYGNYNLIKGLVFADLNSNGIRDVGEPPIVGKKIIEQNNSRFTFSDHNGKYVLSVLDSGNFTTYPQPINGYNPVPLSQTANFTGILQTDSLNDFAFQPQGTFEDVCITITPLGNFRSGFNASYMISYGNYGNTTVTPTVYFYPYSNVTFQSATVTPNQIFPDSVIWNLPALTPFQTGSIIVTVNVDPGLPIGTLINSSAHIEPYATDDNPSCNNSNWEVYTTGSFDPNDILVNEDTLTTTQLASAPWLEYIIRFQNTGNDTAFTVKILNPIDTNKLNLSTFEFTNASHPVNLNWINYQRNMEFKFENILLVDSNTNEPLSHGFVRYRIQPKTTLTAGDSITNFAAIYFDFNEPVITNTAKTYIILPTGIASASTAQGKLHVFPNPTENTINISGIQLENGKAQLRLTDIYGKLILEKTVTTTTSTLETNQLANGVYLIQSGGRRATFVKQ
ncbi:MAG: T9SS type A sorting domain-containing protein [Bacteroidetes bacterium]|nr:T9SS type A sorting domain-containing protein [Bacteroidota bacterium]